jgi:YbbR domain-containing protein
VIAMLRHNFGLKIIAFLIAVAAWGFTRATDPIEEWQMMFDVSIRLSEDTALVSRVPPDHTVTAYVTGPVSRLERLQTSAPDVILDARNIRPGESRVVHPRLERRFAGVDIQFDPPSFEISVGELARAEFAPEEVAEGHLPTGYFIDSRIGLPTQVTVEGAASLLERVVKVVYYLNRSSLTGSTELSVEFYPVDENGTTVRNLTLTPAMADIGISLQPSQALKAVPVVVDYQGTPAANYALTSLSSDPFLVEVSGPAELLTDVVSVRTAPINLTGKTSSFEQSVALLPPKEGVSLSVSRATVSVEIEQIESRTTFENLLIELRGANPAYEYNVSPQRVNVGIRGGPERISQVTADLIRPDIDLSGLEPGQHEVRVSVGLPSGVQNDGVMPPTVTVTVTERTPETEEEQPEEVATPPDEPEDETAETPSG